jgi:hypothetical protein
MFNPQPKPVKQPKKQKKHIKRVSTKRAKQEREYRKLRVQFLTDNPVCQIGVKGCTHESTDVHHMAGKENELLIEVAYFKACCRNCHDYAHDNPIEAIEKGYSISRKR